MPKNLDRNRKHPLMVLVHGGVHSNFGTIAANVVRELTEQGYVIIAPEYRGSTGYGGRFWRQIDYEGEELVFSGYEYDPDNRSFSAIIEATDETPVGKHVLMFVGDEQETEIEIILYVLKREDRALLQRDLVRCPWMTSQYVDLNAQEPPRPPTTP